MKEVWPVISSAWSDNGNRLSRTFVYATRVVSANRQRPPNHRNINYLEEARCTSIELCAHTGTWKNTREAWAALVAPWVFIQLFPVRIKNWKTCAVLYRVMESTKEVEKKTTHRVGTPVVSEGFPAPFSSYIPLRAEFIHSWNPLNIMRMQAIWRTKQNKFFLLGIEVYFHVKISYCSVPQIGRIPTGWSHYFLRALSPLPECPIL